MKPKMKPETISCIQRMLQSEANLREFAMLSAITRKHSDMNEKIQKYQQIRDVLSDWDEWLEDDDEAD